jgi:hypothetical protein
MTCNFLVSDTVAVCRCVGIPFAVGDINSAANGVTAEGTSCAKDRDPESYLFSCARFPGGLAYSSPTEPLRNPVRSALGKQAVTERCDGDRATGPIRALLIRAPSYRRSSGIAEVPRDKPRTMPRTIFRCQRLVAQTSEIAAMAPGVL